jgi:hypothetical protein
MRRRGQRMECYLDQWRSASRLKKGEHLKTPNGQDAIADGGSTPANHDGWMWDLTVQDDHDFYVLPAGEGTDGYYHVDENGVTAVLVHNCPTKLSEIADKVQAQLKGNDLAFNNRTVGIMRTSNGDLVAANAGLRLLAVNSESLRNTGLGPFRLGKAWKLRSSSWHTRLCMVTADCSVILSRRR